MASEGRTTLVIAHRLATIHADRIVVVENGHVVEQGSHAQLIGKANGRYRRLYTAQIGRPMANSGGLLTFETVSAAVRTRQWQNQDPCCKP